MAQDLVGDWRSFVLIGGVPILEGIIHLKKIEGEDIKNSTFEVAGSNPIEIKNGKVKKVGNTFHMSMERDEVTSTRTKKYDASLVIDLGPILAVFVGSKSTDDDEKAEPMASGTSNKTADFVQDDGTVIITRP